MKNKTRDMILFFLTFGASVSTILVWGMVAFKTGFVHDWSLTTLMVGAGIHTGYIILLSRYHDFLNSDGITE